MISPDSNLFCVYYLYKPTTNYSLKARTYATIFYLSHHFSFQLEKFKNVNANNNKQVDFLRDLLRKRKFHRKNRI